MSERPTKRVAVLAPMRPELKAVVRAGSLTRTENDAVFSHSGSAGEWTVLAGVIGITVITSVAVELTLRFNLHQHLSLWR